MYDKLDLYIKYYNTLCEMQRTAENAEDYDVILWVSLVDKIEEIDEKAKHELTEEEYEKYIYHTDHISNRLYFVC